MTDAISAINKHLDAEGLALKKDRGEYFATRTQRQICLNSALAAELGVQLQHQPTIAAPGISAQAAAAPAHTIRSAPLSRWGRLSARRKNLARA